MKEQQLYYENKLNYEVDSYDLYQALKQGEKIIVIDARSNESFENEHISGAINLPHRTMNVETTIRFDRDTLYVCYCDGIGCNASTKGALNMLKLGFKVKELIGGLEWWKKEGYETQGEKACDCNKDTCGCQ